MNAQRDEDEKPEVEDERSGKKVGVFQFPDEHKQDLDRRMKRIRYISGNLRRFRGNSAVSAVSAGCKSG